MKKNYYWIKKEAASYLSELNKIERNDGVRPLDKATSIATAGEGVSSIGTPTVIDDHSNTESENRTRVVSPFRSTSSEPQSLGESPCRHSSSDSESLHESPVPPISSKTQLDLIDGKECDLGTNLKCWYNEFNVSQVAFKGLLEILRPYHPELPLDPRTILKTKDFEIENFSTGGEFTYYGLCEGIKNNLHFDVTQVDTIKIDVFIDGVPIFKSRNTSFWPIICSCSNSVDYRFNSIHPFLVAIFYGDKKPNVDEYLKKFISELKVLLECGLFIAERHYNVILRCVIADAPARAFLKQVKCHGGYSCCDRCVTKGVYKNRSMSYNEINATKRDNNSFRSKSDADHHTGTSPFVDLDIDMISDFVYDYLHVVLLGIVRKLLSLFWHKIPYKLSVGQKKVIDGKVKEIEKYFPSEFARKPRSFKELERFKGSEFRTILLYSGPVIFSEVLPEKQYNHFLILMYIIRIFCTKELLCDDNIEYAQKLAVVFVKQFSKIYKQVNASYNVHSLIHIGDDIKKFGVIDSFSGFPYESFLGNIKKKIRSSNSPLAQINRRISEGYQLNKKSCDCVGLIIKEHSILPNKFKDSIVILS